ncbi:MAG: anaerobic sulfatase maturase [Kiritimatiellia bacterium]
MAFSLLVKPASADCNLRCSYCFYLDKCRLYPETVRHRMSHEVLEQMIRSYMATSQPQYVFGWQGGEPTLMGLDFFKEVTVLQARWAPRGAVVANGLQTNGTLLTDEFARHLAQYKFLCGISLDGPPAIHDSNRRTPDGRGTHAAVLRGIEMLKRHGVEFNVLTLVSSANVGHPLEIYRYLRDSGFVYQQYIECVEFAPNGELAPYAISGRQWGEFLCTVFDEWWVHDTRQVSVRLFDSILTLLVTGGANLCQMANDCRQYFVVEYNGDVYPCDFFVDPYLRLGNVTENTWEEMLTSSVYAEFGSRKRMWNEACRRCAFVRFCAGDCPKNRPLRARDPRRLSVLCEGWRRFYAHALPRLEQLAQGIRVERMGGESPGNMPGAGCGSRLPGRNDPCPCGSGRKFKRCCG